MIVEFWPMGHEMAGKMAWQGSWAGRGKVLRISATQTGQSDSPWRRTSIWRGRGRPLRSLCNGQCPVMEGDQKPKFRANFGFGGHRDVFGEAGYKPEHHRAPEPDLPRPHRLLVLLR